jgi:hypothetical protein
MITIVEGSIKDIKEEMKAAKKEAQKQLSGYKKKYFKRGYFTGPEHVKSSMTWLEILVKVYTVSSVIPVQIEDKIFNYKLLNDFQKKLKGFYTSVEIDGYTLILRYGKRPGDYTGQLQLYDITEYFKTLQKIPKAEIEEGR